MSRCPEWMDSKPLSDRTLKEQVIYGRIFNDIEEVRSAKAEFVRNVNAH